MAFTGRPALEGIDANKEGLDALAAKSLSVGARARLRREQAAAAAAAPPAAPSPPPVDVSGLSVGARARLRRGRWHRRWKSRFAWYAVKWAAGGFVEGNGDRL